MANARQRKKAAQKVETTMMEKVDVSRESKAKETHELAVNNFNISEKFGYRFIQNVKKIRDDRYYKELGYANFDSYCSEFWGVDRKYISERISMVDKYSEEEFVGYNRQFGHRKSLLLSRMDDEHREQVVNEGIPTDKGSKSVDQATQKEINDFKRQRDKKRKAKEQARSERDSARQSEQIALDKAEKAEDKAERKPEPEVKTEYIETVPDDYEQLRKENEELRKEINELRDKYEIDEREYAVNDHLNRGHRELTADLKRIVNKHEGFENEGAKLIELSKEDEEIRENMNCFITFLETLIERTFKDETIRSGIV